MLISRIAFNSYRPEAGRTLAVHGAALDDDEIAQALKIRVREVSVFGEPPVSEDRENVQPFAEVFKPSRAFPGSFGERTSTYEDGETVVYLSIFQGDGHVLLGRNKSFSDKSVALKVGVTNDPKRRLSELNAGLPPAAIGKWGLLMTSQPFPSKAGAEEVEALFKEQAAQTLESLGGEFFWGSQNAAERLFCKLPGMARF